MTYYLYLYLSVYVSTHLFICDNHGRASAEMASRSHARACHRGRGSEKARKRDLDPVRLFTGYKYKTRAKNGGNGKLAQKMAEMDFSDG